MHRDDARWRASAPLWCLSLWHTRHVFNPHPDPPMSNAADEVALLRGEIEILMQEREQLLLTVGAASVLVANLQAEALPESALDAGDILAESLNALPEDLLREALERVRPLVERDLEQAGGES